MPAMPAMPAMSAILALVRYLSAPLVCLACVLATAGPLAAQPPGTYHDDPELPVGPVAERARQVVEAVNAGDRESLRELVETAFSPALRNAVPLERYLDVLGSVQRQSGGLEIHGIRRYDPPLPPEQGHVIIVRGTLTDEWQGLVLQLEGGAPYRITGIQLVSARVPTNLPAAEPLDREGMVAELAAYVERLADEGKFSGTVVVADGGEVLFSGAWGEASRRYGVPNRLDTRFDLASVQKMFTAVAVLQLAHGGELALTDPLSRSLGSDWLPREIASKIELRHLLTHTSGLGNYLESEAFVAFPDRYRKLDDFKPLVRGETLAFEPGTGRVYSNTGMLLLGAVIEAVSGEDYFDYLERHVYGPAGMESTGCFERDVPVPDLAQGYTWRQGRWIENTFLHMVMGSPAAGCHSTAPDLARFARALRDGVLMPRPVADELWKPRPELGSMGYGYGFIIDGPPGASIVGHTGGLTGVSASLDLFLASEIDAAVLSNVDEGALPVLHKIRELVDRLDSPRSTPTTGPARETFPAAEPAGSSEARSRARIVRR